MPDLEQNIRDWLHEQPDWLQEAAQILVTAGSASDTDIKSLVARLKTPEGQAKNSHRGFLELARGQASVSELRLLEVGGITGIENLEPRKPLEFGKGNLCIIYGPNGSGKSGYTRLLKRVCGKPRARELRSNVFRPTPAQRACKISYQVAGSARHVEWPADGVPVEDLRPVDIFDAEAALNYLTGETAAAYTPPTVALFEGLTKVCDRVKAQLQTDQERLVSALPTLPPAYLDTAPGIAYGMLKAGFDEAALQCVVQWREDDKRTLEQLTERLKTADPGALARAKRGTKGQLNQLAEVLQSAATALAAARIVEIRALRADAVAKRRIATESVQVTSAKLDGIGTKTWQALWGAARAYSQTAYPGKAFPVVDDALCLLCHQGLDPDAKQRFREFDAFVEGTLEADAKTAERTYRESLEQLPAALTNDEITTRCQAAGLVEHTWKERLETFWGDYDSARCTLLDGEVTKQATPVEPASAFLSELITRSDSLEQQAVVHDLDAKGFDRGKATTEKKNLEALQWTAQQASAIRSEVIRLGQVADYDTWKRSANSQRISVKAGDVAEQVITAAFVDRFNRELKALGASRIKVELVKSRTEKAKALHKLRLKGARTEQDLPDSVLSDGERRIVALAAFLADVAERSHPVPFVFDDPISSLDHDFEGYVATRLAQLATDRQVIIFTHRLSLYGAMEDAAQSVGEKWKKAHLEQRCIESFSGVSGQPADQEAWIASTAEANQILLQRLDAAKRAGDNDGPTAYRGIAQGMCSDFRKLLERTVEDDLLNKVVKRHRRSVTTDHRLPALSRITQDDCDVIDHLMSKYSCYEHSQSTETPSVLPDEPELRSDLESLKVWRELFKKRPAAATR